jgi:hypothetical protein
MFWPGEFGRYQDALLTCVQLSPIAALLLWPACLVPWRTRTCRTLMLMLVLLIPGWSLPVLLGVAGEEDLTIRRMWGCLFGAARGKDWQEVGVVLPAAVLWWLLLVPLILLTIKGRSPANLYCKCGYSTIGLTGKNCPECGTEIEYNSRDHARAPRRQTR